LADAQPEGSTWTFLSNHAHVIICIAADPTVRMRDIALMVNITERAVQRIIAEMEKGGYLTSVRQGRRNSYIIHGDRPLRHHLESHRTLQHLIDLGLEGKKKKK
jgi:DNA-binding MarR family transcriptional regulator